MTLRKVSPEEAEPSATWSAFYGALIENGKHCALCGKWFSGSAPDAGYRLRDDALYCSNACRQAMYRLRRQLSSGHPIDSARWVRLVGSPQPHGRDPLLDLDVFQTHGHRPRPR